MSGSKKDKKENKQAHLDKRIKTIVKKEMEACLNSKDELKEDLVNIKNKLHDLQNRQVKIEDKQANLGQDISVTDKPYLKQTIATSTKCSESKPEGPASIKTIQEGGRKALTTNDIVTTAEEVLVEDANSHALASVENAEKESVVGTISDTFSTHREPINNENMLGCPLEGLTPGSKMICENTVNTSDGFEPVVFNAPSQFVVNMGSKDNDFISSESDSEGASGIKFTCNKNTTSTPLTLCYRTYFKAEDPSKKGCIVVEIRHQQLVNDDAVNLVFYDECMNKLEPRRVNDELGSFRSLWVLDLQSCNKLAFKPCIELNLRTGEEITINYMGQYYWSVNADQVEEKISEFDQLPEPDKSNELRAGVKKYYQYWSGLAEGGVLEVPVSDINEENKGNWRYAFVSQKDYVLSGPLDQALLTESKDKVQIKVAAPEHGHTYPVILYNHPK